MIFLSVIFKKIPIIFIHSYLHCCKILKGHISNSSNISDFVNIVEIKLTQSDSHRIGSQNRKY